MDVTMTLRTFFDDSDAVVEVSNVGGSTMYAVLSLSDVRGKFSVNLTPSEARRIAQALCEQAQIIEDRERRRA